MYRDPETEFIFGQQHGSYSEVRSKFKISFLLHWLMSLRADRAPWTILSGILLTFLISSQSMLGLFLIANYTFDPYFVSLINEDWITDSLYFGELAKWHTLFVDYIFFFCYVHLFRKIYIKAYTGDGSLTTWSMGIFVFLVLHYVIFLGIVLTGTQVGELTILIGANILHSFSLYQLDFYVWLFGSSKTPTSDILVRFGVMHFILGLYIIHLALVHVFLQHEKYGAGESFPLARVDSIIPFYPETSAFEINAYVTFILFIWGYSSRVLHHVSSAPVIHYFAMRPTGYVWQINYYIICPHWYFYPYMGFLTAVPQHFEAMFLLVVYILSMLILPWVQGDLIRERNFNFECPMSASLIHDFFYFGLIFSYLYVEAALPTGRYYISVEVSGNVAIFYAYLYIISYYTWILYVVDEVERWSYGYTLDYFSKIKSKALVA